jgi:hypothetical protein
MFPQLVIHVFPRYTSIPPPSNSYYVTDYWSNLLLYYPFRKMPKDIGLSNNTITSHREQMKIHTPHGILNVQMMILHTQLLKIDLCITFPHLNPWTWMNGKSFLIYTQQSTFNLLTMTCSSIVTLMHTITENIVISLSNYKKGSQYVDLNCVYTQNQHSPSPNPPSMCSFSPTQNIAFNTIISHFTKKQPTPPLKMVIQGMVGIGNSYLIICIQALLIMHSTNTTNPSLLLAPTSVATFNINSLTMHSSLHIPITSMHPLEGQSLLHLQE